MASEIVDRSELRDGTASLTKGQENRLTYTSTFNYLVVTDSQYVSREEVLLGTPGLPVVGLIYGAINAICVKKSATRSKENARYWNVSCDFDTGREDQKQDPSNPNNPDPTTWIPIFSIDGFETEQRVINRDYSTPSKSVVNSAGQPFSPRPTRSLSRCSCTFTQFETPGQDVQVFIDRNDTVNDATFIGRSARRIRLNVTGAELGYFGNYRAWKATYKMTFGREDWDLDLLNVGTLYNDAGVLKPYTDGLNATIILGKLTTGGAKLTPATADPEILSFQIYKRINFASFIRT